MGLHVLRFILVCVMEVEEGCRAIVREMFLHFMLLLECVLAFLLNCWDEGYARNLEARGLRTRRKRRYWAVLRESSLNGVVTGRVHHAMRKSSTDEDGQRGASMISRLPQYPTLNTDVMGGQGHGLLDDLQLLAELSIIWVFWMVKLPLSLLERKGNICGQIQQSITQPHENGPGEGSEKVDFTQGALSKVCYSLYPGRESISTAGDVIQISGYPLEVHKAVTIDGYILYMYRIPRPHSPRATFFLHGMGDSSICWVSGGVAASPAFEAYNLGFDVWLGNSRNTPPREHVDPEVEKGFRYWKFTSNELGELDVSALVNLIDAVKSRELSQARMLDRCPSCIMQHTFEQSDTCTAGSTFDSGRIKPHSAGRYHKEYSEHDPQWAEPCKNSGPEKSGEERNVSLDVCTTCRNCNPKRIKLDLHQELTGVKVSTASTEQMTKKLYTLSAVGHSLGCASLLIYVISSLRKCQKHRLNQLVLLAPAGFHRYRAPMALFSNNFLKPIAWILIRVLRLPGYGVQMPAGLTRFTAFKCLHDFRQVQALGEIAQRFVHFWTRDRSPWHKAACALHYVSHYTPGMSLHSGLHMVQWFHTGNFGLYDYGSDWANMVHYGTAKPPDIAAEYGRIDIPVEFMSGRNDGVISNDDVLMHVEAARKAGVNCRYWGFNCSHLEFSMCMADEVKAALLNCI